MAGSNGPPPSAESRQAAQRALRALEKYRDAKAKERKRTERLEPLRRLVAHVEVLRRLPPDNTDLAVWFDDLVSAVETLCGGNSEEYQTIVGAPYVAGTVIGYPGEPPIYFAYRVKLDKIEAAAKVILNRVEKGRAPTPLSSATKTRAVSRAKIFISHGPPGTALRKLGEFLTALNIDPVIVEERPSEGRSVVSNVDKYARDCRAAIVLATRDREVDGQFEPNPGVLVEIGDLRKRFGNRVAYLVESGLWRSALWSEQVYIGFESDQMDEAFIRLIRELTAFGLLEAGAVAE